MINFGGFGISPIKKIHEFVAHPTKVNCVNIGPLSGQVLATGGDDKKVNVWRLGSPASIWSMAGNSTPVDHVCFDPDEQYLVSGSRGGAVKVYDLNEGKVSRSLPGHRSNITSIHYHPFGEFVVSGSVDTNVKIWDVRKKVCIQTYKGHDLDVTSVRFSPDGRWVASAAKNGGFKLWDLTSGKLLNSWQLPPRVHMTSLCFNPSEFILAACTSERVVRLYDMETFELMGSTTPESGAPVRAVCFNPTGDVLLSATGDACRAWTWEDHLVPPSLHNEGIGGVAGFGQVPAPSAAPLTCATTVRCLRSSDAPWGKNIGELIPFASNGNLMAANIQTNTVSVFSGELTQLGASAREPVDPTGDIPDNDQKADNNGHNQNQHQSNIHNRRKGGGVGADVNNNVAGPLNHFKLEDIGRPVTGGGFLPLGSRAKAAGSPKATEPPKGLIISPPEKPSNDALDLLIRTQTLQPPPRDAPQLGSQDDDDLGHTYVDDFEAEDDHQNDVEFQKTQYGDEVTEENNVMMQKTQYGDEVTEENHVMMQKTQYGDEVSEGDMKTEHSDEALQSREYLDEKEEKSNFTLEMKTTRRNRTGGGGWSKEMTAHPAVSNPSEGDDDDDVHVGKAVMEGMDQDNENDDERLAEQMMKLTDNLRKSMLPGAPKFSLANQTPAEAYRSTFRSSPTASTSPKKFEDKEGAGAVKSVPQNEPKLMGSQDNDTKGESKDCKNIEVRHSKVVDPLKKFGIGAMTPRDDPQRPRCQHMTPPRSSIAEAKDINTSTRSAQAKSSPRKPWSAQRSPRQPLNATPKERGSKGTPRESLSSRGTPRDSASSTSREPMKRTPEQERIRNLDIDGSTLLAQTRPLLSNPLSLSNSFVEKPMRAAPPPPNNPSMPPTTVDHQVRNQYEEPTEDKMIASLLKGRTDLCAALSHRTAHLKVLGDMWNRGDTAGAISHLHQISSIASGSNGSKTEKFLQRGVAVDFFARIDLLSVESLTLDVASRLLPILIDLIDDASLELPQDIRGKKLYSDETFGDGTSSSSNDKLVLIRSASVALSTTSCFIKAFGERVQAVRMSKHVLGVDVSRDERQQRCAACYRSFSSINDRVRRIRGAPNGNSFGPFSSQLSRFSKSFDDVFGSIVS